MYCCTRIQYVALAIILSNSGERMHRDRIPLQRMHAACRIVTRGSCCTKRFAEFNGNCESFCSLEQLVASLCAADEGKSASGTYHPKTEGGYIRYLYRPSGWTHGHNPPQTSCAPYPTGRLGTGSRPWKARVVLSQNLDENNNIQTSTDRCTTSSTVNSSVWYWCVCVCYIQFAGDTRVYVVQWCRSKLCTTCCRWWYHFYCVANKERRPRKDTRHAGPPAKRICLPRSVDALARLPNKHNNRPRCLRPPTVPTCSQLGDTRATSTWPSRSHHQASQTAYPP